MRFLSRPHIAEILRRVQGTRCGSECRNIEEESLTEREGMAWVRALRQYKYPVNLALFRVGRSFSDKWFRANLRHGDWQETVQFEARFREFGPKCLEAWYEVVFWKLFSLPLVRNGHFDISSNFSSYARLVLGDLSASLLASISFNSSCQESSNDLAPSVCRSVPSFAISMPTRPNSANLLKVRSATRNALSLRVKR
jgi:hypothetical protein